ncbi:MAG: glycogen-binding domain-containing protein [Myxococcota bacterium]|nr:glycogen-binding domain-containing protein [Myxococcota bacterium]
MHDDPGKHLTVHQAPPDLMERVLAHQVGPHPAPIERPGWRIPAAIAASFCLGILLGRGAPTAAPDSLEPVAVRTTEQSPALTPIRLVYHAEQAVTVAVAGSWSSWEPEPMQLTEDGMFFTVIALPAGRHEYMFVIDGEQWASDPTALLTHDDGFGQKNAVIQIGA